MVMKMVIPELARPSLAAPRYSVAEAMAGLSALLRVADHRPTRIHR
jgi:hypothetical protein